MRIDPQSERDYVLGTHDEEMQRLELQHQIWRPIVLDCWQRAGITQGSRVLDVGAGPGYAAVDLAEIVGPRGQVIAVERSNRYVNAAKALCQSRNLENVRVHELDLMEDPLPAVGMDAVWCRWVACFVSSPEKLISKLAAALKAGGVAIFHEYVDYSTFRFVPPRKALEEFVQHVMASWRASAGEPDISRQLPPLLGKAGFKIRYAAPRIFCARPGEATWQWPASFINININRLLELGRVDEAWASDVRRELAMAEKDSNSLILTPLLLELIATKNDAVSFPATS